MNLNVNNKVNIIFDFMLNNFVDRNINVSIISVYGGHMTQQKIPPIRRVTKYEIDKLEPKGASKEYDISEANRVRQTASMYAKRHGMEFVSRTVINDEGKEVLRLWRTK